MTQPPIHITIIGAGLGGLCLAQSLKKRGIAFDVFEKDAAPDSRTQGYRIRIDAAGQRALASALPQNLFDLFLETCAVAQTGGQFIAPDLAPVPGRAAASWRPSATEDGGGDRSANRQTLREILLTGIEEYVHFGRAFELYEADGDETLRVICAGGAPVESNILVAADGVRSAVRAQHLPSAAPQPTGAACIYGKTPMNAPFSSDALASGTSVVFADDFAVVIDAMRFQFPQAAKLAPVEDYFYWAVIGRTRRLGIADDAAGPHGGRASLATIAHMTSNWHPTLRALFAHADAASVAALPIHSAHALTPWKPSRVTLLGDAVHAMSPAGGLGANTALADAVALAERLAQATSDQTSLLEAVGAYEHDMRVRANAALEVSQQGAAHLFGNTVGI